MNFCITKGKEKVKKLREDITVLNKEIETKDKVIVGLKTEIKETHESYEEKFRELANKSKEKIN